MKTLVLMRHGEAENADRDFSRALTPRGKEQCRVTAQEFLGANFKFQRVLCSSAARALASANIVSQLCACTAQVDDRRSLYLAQADEYLAAIRQTPATVDSLLLVAHNPGLSTLAAQLRQKRVALATGDYAVIEVDLDDWQGLGTE